MKPDDALIICRILQDVSSVLLWGTYAYLSTLVPSTLAKTIGERLETFKLVATAIAFGATFAVLPIEASILGDGWGVASDLTLIQDIVLDSSIGNAWLVQAFAATALVMTIWLAPRRQHVATALCAGLLLGCRALVGHSVMLEGGTGKLLQVSYLVHVLSAGAWLGALMPLLLVLRELNKHGNEQDAGVALQRFSASGHVVVLLAVSTGFLNTGLILGRVPLEWSHPYHLLLSAKIFIVGGMILIALINRYIIVPRIKLALRPNTHLLLYTTTLELALGFCALVLVNLFGTFSPA